ncbi:hypothetical protein ACEUZ9_003939 [Paracoccus litorisediminis]|uniref:Uncharacterized protein n=1 Tax=Paracoccus litorisediminis TaxID=2006130 RepID=A0A844HGW8_9RHOB|nr:hypothetical protein [Paracoccus litorisediminis]MTH58158.1 hypothetical protein [Paracoccus litorisediminis]
MIGVVLWSDPPREKAIIWCEDHAALAYLQGRDNLLAEKWPEAGDLVELDCEDVGQHRLARRVSLLSAPGKSQLPGILRKMADTPPPPLRVISNDDYDAAPRSCRIAAAG